MVITRASKRIKKQLLSLREIANDSEEENNEINEDDQYRRDSDSDETDLSSNEFETDDLSESDDELPPFQDIVQFVEDEEIREQQINIKLTSKNGKKWSLKPIGGRYRMANVIRHQPGPTTAANILVNQTIWSSVNLFMSDDIINLIIINTNKYATSNEINLNFNYDLFKKFIGLVLARSVFSAPKVSVDR